MACRHRLPGFRATCIAIGALYVLLGGSILARGVPASMAPYGLPQATLDSPHFVDAIWWVYTHMVVLGLIMVALGWLAESHRLKLWMARILFGAHVSYTWMDIRSSDSAWGTGLYQGPESLAPAVIAGLAMLAFAHLGLCLHREPTAPDAPDGG